MRRIGNEQRKLQWIEPSAMAEYVETHPCLISRNAFLHRTFCMADAHFTLGLDNILQCNDFCRLAWRVQNMKIAGFVGKN